ncbi:uncharacterized protein MYCFIDRAFT_195052 [Pseudocercospora fijiensis CIRAD86]|uniref:SET domain-containing protein n=1 Tax=Pseudocercospora fijiensis (strain CIRAD86) TaxID=383855 RepID=M3B386_PSEFD|nr:uncharacterized protein MYCFIDRAFT_195052 [Pseudocercospora fijiensis CIRAD86]EME83832.1 hypothetical protein MYCFIDRAFT_195052 [Pseudocercospora fijiensis CIRAD86]
MARDANPSNALLLQRFPHLHLVSNTAKGRGVFASAPIPAGTIIDVSPVLILSIEENLNHIEHTSLYHYTYNWPTKSSDGTPQKSQAVVLGLGSMFNHSTQNQNVGWKRDLDREVIVYRALKDIVEGEELCISYGDHLTFVDADKKMEEEAEDVVEVLGRIDVDVDVDG